jgi:hypothetical protein
MQLVWEIPLKIANKILWLRLSIDKQQIFSPVYCREEKSQKRNYNLE